MSSDLHNDDRAFPATIWAMIERAGQGDAEAVAELLARYRGPLCACLRFKFMLPEERVEELFQNFVGDKVVQKNCIAAADQRKGKFRNFLLTTFLNHVRSELRKENARRPEGGFVFADDSEAAEIPAPSNDAQIERIWWQSVVAEVLERVRSDYQSSGKQTFWELFESRLVRPMLHEEPPLDYETAIQRFRFESPQQAFAALLDAKRKFKSYLRMVVAEYEQNHETARTELLELGDLVVRLEGKGAKKL